MTSILLSSLIVIVLVGFGLAWRMLIKIERRIDKIETLINSLGDHIGSYIDVMEGDGK